MKDYPVNNIICPKFYYSGRRGAASDRNWILGKLSRLDRENARNASDVYESIYLKLFNDGQYIEARKQANQWLSDFVDKYGISKSELDQIKASEKTQRRIFELIEKCKAAKPRSPSILEMSRKSKGRI